nr:glycosyltransferase family 2 protein [Saprospiraceae bacterium]
MITAIILTYNEQIHIERCIKSLQKITNKIIVVDSQSKDKTLGICEELSVQVYQNPFVNQAQQFNWALENCDISTDWVIRLDADEYLTDELAKEIIPAINSATENTTGFYLKRRVYFMGKWIKYGGYYPTKLLRIWKKNCGKYENRWMDEHVILEVGE